MIKGLEDWYNLHEFYKHNNKYLTKELAEYIKVSPRTIQRWIAGKSKPTKEKLALIKQYLCKQSD